MILSQALSPNASVTLLLIYLCATFRLLHCSLINFPKTLLSGSNTADQNPSRSPNWLTLTLKTFQKLAQIYFSQSNSVTLSANWSLQYHPLPPSSPSSSSPPSPPSPSSFLHRQRERDWVRKNTSMGRRGRENLKQIPCPAWSLWRSIWWPWDQPSHHDLSSNQESNA